MLNSKLAWNKNKKYYGKNTKKWKKYIYLQLWTCIDIAIYPNIVVPYSMHWSNCNLK